MAYAERTDGSPREIAILGVGSRGQVFGDIVGRAAHLGRVVAVADVRPAYRERAAARFGLSADRVFDGWEAFCARPKFCDAVVIATGDREHVGPAVACLDRGYDVLLEKPMGVSLAECRRIEEAQRRSKRIVGVCHSLRYQKGFRKLKEMVAAGAVGRVITIDHLEQVGIFHHAHSFVRGNWGNEGRSTFMLLAKSCHDMDYLAYLVDRPCLAVSSFGALTYFRPEHAPPGAGERCVACAVEDACPFSALKQYVQTDRTRWWANTVSPDHSYESHAEAIRTGPYGRCVWKCDNDVVDHQVVTLHFEGDVTATFTMTAFSEHGGRRIRVHGTHGEILFDQKSITLKTFADRNVQVTTLGDEPGAHGGGDERLCREWLHALHTRDDAAVVANAQESLKTHTITFAAERARREGRVVHLSEM